MTSSGQGIQQTVLVVDDTKENLNVIGHLLRPYYHVRVANSGLRALEIAESAPQPDLILLDVMMPEMDGYQVLSQLRQKAETSRIPVIFVTAMDADENEEHGLSLGAVDYIAKPVKPALLLARVKAHLELKASRDRLADQNAYLDAEVHRRMLENELIKDFSLHALATLAEKRDNETGNHLHRTKAYVEVLMEKLKSHPRFAAQLADPLTRQRIAKAAPLHDIGKVGIPDAILLKPGKLTPEEFEVMKTHASIGAQAIDEAIDSVNAGRKVGNEQTPDITSNALTASALDFLEVCKQIAGGHHEKWDGSGYPLGLVGEKIPLPARLMAIADVFDALMSRRHYKAAYPLDETIRLIQAGRAKHFDPDIVDAFLELQQEFVNIANRYSDVPKETESH
ncbi:response regulator [Undibacterium fentianense]|uniref:Two-component system response regulator n=1 Tax=Undibacterium fentianense TaxID=2828728 RepID=A0A941IEX4_9BURK|nr:two-component system response regulator [Undibacterium fentianense]MBR7799832.1 two-component system response regulator [Undibacterium fentianense]